MGRDHVQHAGFLDLRFFIFRGNEEIGGQRHDFPGEQEADTVPGQHHSAHTGGHEAEEKGHRANGTGVVVGVPVGARIQSGTAGNEEDGDEKPGRQGIEAEVDRTEGECPGQLKQNGVAGKESDNRAGQAEA